MTGVHIKLWDPLLWNTGSGLRCSLGFTWGGIRKIWTPTWHPDLLNHSVWGVTCPQAPRWSCWAARAGNSSCSAGGLWESGSFDFLPSASLYFLGFLKYILLIILLPLSLFFSPLSPLPPCTTSYLQHPPDTLVHVHGSYVWFLWLLHFLYHS